MTTTHIDRAARIIAEAVVHGTSDDPALDAARALDGADLLATPRQLSPAALATLAECRKAKSAAYTAGVETAGMPGSPSVTAARGEVRFVVHPRTLADWARWTHDLGVAGVRADSTGAAMVVRFTYGGVRARLVGYGVPALYSAMHDRAGVQA